MLELLLLTLVVFGAVKAMRRKQRPVIVLVIPVQVQLTAAGIPNDHDADWRAWTAEIGGK